MKQFVEASIQVKEADGATWTLEVDNEEGVTITGPCGENSALAVGRKGKFFADLNKAYKAAATTAGIYDTKVEDFETKYEVENDD